MVIRIAIFKTPWVFMILNIKFINYKFYFDKSFAHFYNNLYFFLFIDFFEWHASSYINILGSWFFKSSIIFICAYKPPDVCNASFLDYLQDIILGLDQNSPLFIVGDLNMDLKSKNGNDLNCFMINNDYKNFVTQYTRIKTNYYKKKDKFITSKTLIDVVIHNKNNIQNIMNINCPYSDHKF